MTRMLAGLIILGSLATPLAAQGGRGGAPGGMGGGERKILAQFDRDGNRHLDATERQAALASLGSTVQNGGGRSGMMGGRGAVATGPITPGPKLSPAEVKNVLATTPFYDLGALRTVFLTFEDANWEKELLAFNNTDVELLATMTIDGKTYRDVGIHARGASSFGMVPEGQKHSLNVTVDFVHDSQSVMGYRTLNLLNAHEDPSLLRTVLYYQVARSYLPALKANFVRVVINGESWGIYTSMEQFNKDFVRDNFQTTAGARWKVTGSPNGRGGLEYLGDDPTSYKTIYEIKTKDEAKPWADFIALTKILNQTPPEQLETALAPVLDIDGALKFLALDVALVNNDGYWTRASDYSIYQDTRGRFHILPHDANETFAAGGGGRGGQGRGGPPMGGDAAGGPPMGAGGPPMGAGGPPGGFPGGRGGGRGGPGGMTMGSPTLDPLVGLTDLTKPLRARLLAVPALRTRYLAYVREIATKWLDWTTLGPIAQRHHDLIVDVARSDTRKLDSTADFEASIGTLKAFADQRRTFLMNWQLPR